MTIERDPFELSRFVDAQAPVYDSVVEELTAGRKVGHWMWFVFPQIAGLGQSWMAERYAISGREEARAYAEHPVLGSRLNACTQLVLSVEGRSARQIFGGIDELKFRSCLTLFERSAADPAIFRAALAKYFAGEPDPLTLDLLARQAR